MREFRTAVRSREAHFTGGNIHSTTIQPTPNTMKPNLLVLIGCMFFLGACSKQEPASAPEATSTAPTATEVPAVQPQAPKVVTAERIQEIEASGQTGLWSSTTEVCAKEINQGLRTT